VCSSETLVTAVATGSTALVASYSPPSPTEVVDRHRRDDLEEGEGFAVGSAFDEPRLHLLDEVGDRRFGHRQPVDPNSLGERGEVRRGVEAD